MTSLAITILLVLILFECLEAGVEVLNLRHLEPQIPKEFDGFYDPEKYARSQNYLRVNTVFNLWEQAICVSISLIFLFGGGLNFLDQHVRGWVDSTIWRGVIFLGILSAMSAILHLPFQIYRTFVIEERFGFNQSSVLTFFTDRVKGMVLGIILGLPLLLAVLWFFEISGASAWMWIWGLLIFWQLVLLYIAPTWIMPLFNKFEPLPAGELRDAIFEFAQKNAFALNDIFRMDGSKRSSKANAFFTGFGKSRRIVLFDTLIKNHTVDELVAILAHEIGHYKKQHILRSMLVNFVMLGALLFLLNQLLNNEQIFAAFSVTDTSIYVSLVVISILLGPIQKLISVGMSALSRKHEYEADAYAASTVGSGKNLISALKKLTVDNLGNLRPHPLKVFLEYSHPPVLHRIAALKAHEY